MNYKLLYQLIPKPDGVAKQDIPDGMGACDAGLLCSIIYPEDGGLSVYFLGVDGRKKCEPHEAVLEDIEWFKIWSMLAHRLAESTTLEPIKKSLCAAAFDRVRKYVLGKQHDS